MAGGPNAAVNPCIRCAGKANRVSEGLEDDYYTCEQCGAHFGIDWSQGQPPAPTAAPDSATVGDALARHYVEHGLPPDGGEHQPWFAVHVGPLTRRLPNPPARQRAVFYHDVNHVLTGYNTVFSEGETVIAGFEVGNGCGPFWIAWLINLALFPFGLVTCPRAMFRAFVRGRRASSVYRRRESRAALAAMPVGRLREMLQLDRAPPVARLADRLSFLAWSVAALIVLFAPPLAAVLLLFRVVW